MKRQKKHYTLEDRLYSLLLAVLLAVPTAFLLWWGLNMGLYGSPFISSLWLWLTIAIFLLISVVSPDFFERLLGRVWGLLYRLLKWY